MNFNLIGKSIVKYSKNGAALIRKQAGCNLDDFAQEGLNKIKLPSEAVSYDTVRVGRNFNAAEHYTDIFTFRDPAGKMIGRYSKQVDGEDIKTTFKTVKEFEYDDVDVLDEIIPLDAKKIRGYTRLNGKISECFDETITKADTTNPIVTQFRRTFSPEKETIKLAEYRKGEPVKLIENEYRVIRALRNMFDEHYYSRHLLEKSKATSKELKEIAENPYFLPYVSPRNKFISRVATPIIDEKNFVIEPNIKTYKKVSSTAGSYFNGTLYINKINAKGSAPLRENLVNTIGHEAGHGIWDDLASSYEIVDGGFGTFEEFGINANNLKKVQEYAKSIRNYISSGEDYHAYREQFCERMARAEGYKTQQNYENLEKKVQESFKYKHFNQFYPSHNEGYDTMDLRDALRSLLDYKNIKDLL